ncbi:MAG: cytochrome c1 [Acidocella sp.]|nr:cytochrome c1 [Acidocella sp.]
MKLGISAAALLAAFLAFGSAAYAEDTLSPLHWQSQGTFGSYDQAALQRGFLVYQTACASCHSANALHYRDLTALGLTTEQVADITASIKLDNRPATLDDRLISALPKSQAAAAFGGAVPPDLSNIVAARPKGTEYIYNLLTGYQAPPADVTLMAKHYYNAAYPGNQIAMPAPLTDNAVTYADGTKATTAQEASDVAAFLTWASDPNLDARKQIGLRAVIFLIFLTLLAIATKRKIWRDVA